MQSLSNGKIGDDDLQIAESGNGATRGRDLRMLAAAFLYNITGDRRYEDAMAQESVATSPKWYANKGLSDLGPVASRRGPLARTLLLRQQ